MSDSPFVMDPPDWRVWHPSPSKPAFVPPANAVDAHCHVFGPGHLFPFAPERKYTPCDASKDQLWELREHLGFRRSVIVQATCHGSDNRALVDALQSSNGTAKGIATVKPDIDDDQLQALAAAGVKGIRFNFVKRLVDPPPRKPLVKLAERIKSLGWHLVIYFEAPDLPELFEFISSLPVTVVIDHMGRPDVSKPLDGPEFELFLQLMRDNNHVWSKVSCPERLSAAGPVNYSDVVPFAQKVVTSFPDRVLWGTDWPHPNMKSHTPDDGKLVDVIPRIAPTPELQQKLLVDNPSRLYWDQ